MKDPILNIFSQGLEPFDKCQELAKRTFSQFKEAESQAVMELLKAWISAEAFEKLQFLTDKSVLLNNIQEIQKLLQTEGIKLQADNLYGGVCYYWIISTLEENRKLQGLRIDFRRKRIDLIDAEHQENS